MSTIKLSKQELEKLHISNSSEFSIFTKTVNDLRQKEGLSSIEFAPVEFPIVKNEVSESVKNFIKAKWNIDNPDLDMIPNADKEMIETFIKVEDITNYINTKYK